MAPSLRENWRIALLIVLLVGSLGALFVPGATPILGGSNTAQSGGPTNLQYGLQLSGGTRVRAPVVGLTASNVTLPKTQTKKNKIIDTIASNLSNTSVSDVRLRTYKNSAHDTVEVFANVTPPQFQSALSDAGLDVSTNDIRQGVTAQTRQQIVTTLSKKVNSLGFSGAQVSVQKTLSGEHLIVVEAPNTNLSEIRSLVNSRGRVSVVANHPANGSAQRNDTVLSNAQLQQAQIKAPQMQGRPPHPVVPLTLSRSAAKSFANSMQQYGYTKSPGIQNCHYPNGTPGHDYCLLNVRDGQVVYSAGMGQGLAKQINNGGFQQTKTFVLETKSMSQARQVAADLRAGALPASLDVQNNVYSIDASLAQRFKPLSFLTGLIAAIAVSIVVYLRYGEIRIAAPMLATALSEVVLLLGFASTVGLALNLSHIAGLIAVIGTGVDDLVIIADEVTTESVSSARVFQSRFRKAFWIIGGAAATTIIAMSPLAFLSLGDLRGFAIITIVGVLIGVLLTRPAYGDILRLLITGDDD